MTIFYTECSDIVTQNVLHRIFEDSICIQIDNANYTGVIANPFINMVNLQHKKFLLCQLVDGCFSRIFRSKNVLMDNHKGKLQVLFSARTHIFFTTSFLFSATTGPTTSPLIFCRGQCQELKSKHKQGPGPGVHLNFCFQLVQFHDQLNLNLNMFS